MCDTLVNKQINTVWAVYRQLSRKKIEFNIWLQNVWNLTDNELTVTGNKQSTTGSSAELQLWMLSIPRVEFASVPPWHLDAQTRGTLMPIIVYQHYSTVSLLFWSAQSIRQNSHKSCIKTKPIIITGRQHTLTMVEVRGLKHPWATAVALVRDDDGLASKDDGLASKDDGLACNGGDSASSECTSAARTVLPSNFLTAGWIGVGFAGSEDWLCQKSHQRPDNYIKQLETASHSTQCNILRQIFWGCQLHCYWQQTKNNSA